MHETTKPTIPYFVPIALQKIFVFGMLGSFTVQLAISMLSIAHFIRNGSPFNGLYGYLFVATVLPAGTFLLSFFFNTRPLPRVARWFEAVFMCVVLTAVFNVFISYLLPQSLRLTNFFDFYITATFQVVAGIVYLILSAVTVMWLYKQKRVIQ